MTALGLCVNANGAVPDENECNVLGLGSGDWVRTAIQGSLSLLDGMLERISPLSPVMVTLNNECTEVKSDWSGWEHACQIIATAYAERVKIVGCGNELDSFYYAGGDHVSPIFAANLVKRAAPILQPVGIKVAMSSMASGRWPEYLRTMAVACDGAATYADLHLYVKQLNGVPAGVDWQTAEAALVQAHNLTGLPVISSEAGIKVDDAGGLEAQARWALGLKDLPAELICYWCWHDRMASPGETGGQAFGLRGLDNRQKMVWYSMQHILGGPPAPVVPPSFQLGFRTIAERHPELVGAALENESGPWVNCSLQRTSRGLLMWGNFVVSGSQMGFTANDGTRYLWRVDHLERVA